MNIKQLSMTNNAIRKREKRKLDEGTNKETIRKKNDSYQHQLARRELHNIKDMLLKSPPRKVKLFDCVYIGDNKFADINGIYIEVVYTYDHNDVEHHPPIEDCKNNKINLYQAVQLFGLLRYQKKATNPNQFEIFYLEQCFFSDMTLYRDASLETETYASTFTGENSDAVLAQCKSILEFTDLEICSKWKNANQSYLRNIYESETGVNRKFPVFKSPKL
jgi:hypothetical protein